MGRVVGVLLRITDIIDNASRGTDAAIDNAFNNRVQTGIATDYADGQLRLGIALNTNFGTVAALVTPFGSIGLEGDGAINGYRNQRIREELAREFKAIYTTSSALAQIPAGGVDAQLMVLGVDADQTSLASVPGAEASPYGFLLCAEKLHKNPTGIVSGQRAEAQAAAIMADQLTNAKPYGSATGRKLTGILVTQIEKLGRPLTGYNARYWKSRVLSA
jgi:hypothetical protein